MDAHGGGGGGGGEVGELLAAVQGLSSEQRMAFLKKLPVSCTNDGEEVLPFHKPQFLLVVCLHCVPGNYRRSHAFVVVLDERNTLANALKDMEEAQSTWMVMPEELLQQVRPDSERRARVVFTRERTHGPCHPQHSHVPVLASHSLRSFRFWEWWRLCA